MRSSAVALGSEYFSIYLGWRRVENGGGGQIEGAGPGEKKERDAQTKKETRGDYITG